MPRSLVQEKSVLICFILGFRSGALGTYEPARLRPSHGWDDGPKSSIGLKAPVYTAQILAAEIADDLKTAFDMFTKIAAKLTNKNV